MRRIKEVGDSFSPMAAIIAVIALILCLNILQPLTQSVFSIPNIQFPLLVLGLIVTGTGFLNYQYIQLSRRQTTYSLLLVIPSMYLLMRFSTLGQAPSYSWIRFAFYGAIYFILISRIDRRAFNYFEYLFSVSTLLSLASHLLTLFHVISPYKLNSASHVGYLYGFTFTYFERLDFSNLNAWRFYGLSDEPGAFGVLCFLMFIVNGGKLKKRLNYLYLIAGLLTFSTLFLLLIGTYVILKSRKVLVLSVITYGSIQFVPQGSGYTWWLQYKLLPRPRDLWVELVTRWDSSLVEVLHGGPVSIFFGDGTLSFLMGPPAIIVLSGIIGSVCYACICVIQPKILYLPLAIIFLSRTQFPFMFILVIPLIAQGLRANFESDSRRFQLDRQEEVIGAVHAD